MRTYGESVGPAVDVPDRITGLICTTLHPGRFKRRKYATDLNGIGSNVSLTAGRTALEKRKSCCPYREEKPVLTTAQPAS